MEEQTVPGHRRRKKTKTELFKEAYLPYIILMAAALLIVIFIIGALVRNANEDKDVAQESDAPAISASFVAEQL